MICGHHHIGKVVALKGAGPNRDGLLAKVLNRCALGARQRRTRRTAVIERCQRAVVERVPARPLGAVKPRHQPGIGVGCTGTKATNAPANVELSRNGALVTGEPLSADLYIGYVLPGAAFGDVFFGDADDTVLWLELGIHSLNDVANQRQLLVEFTERP